MSEREHSDDAIDAWLDNVLSEVAAELHDDEVEAVAEYVDHLIPSDGEG
jgi:cytochrome c553